MTATMPLATADKIYTNTIQELRGFIEGHVYDADKEPSVAGFCKAYGIDRSNLVKCLQGQREMSVGLYQRIAVALGLMGKEHACEDVFLFNVPLRMYLRINHDSVKNSIMMVNFS